jgi:hypothetical protein
MEEFIYGYKLNSLVFGSSSIRFATLSLDIQWMRIEQIPLIAQIVGHSLSSLDINLQCDYPRCYEILECFFTQCQWLRNLKLFEFDFDDDPVPLSFEVGFSRLKQLHLIGCFGDVALFIESIHIPNLNSFSFPGYYVESFVNAAGLNYGRSIKDLRLSMFVSSENIIKIVRGCPLLERLAFFMDAKFSISDMSAIASLPRLRYLEFRSCRAVADGAFIALAECRELKYLNIRSRDLKLNNSDLKRVLRVIGRNLIGLILLDMSVDSTERTEGIVEYCPNLQYLDLKINQDYDPEKMRYGQIIESNRQMLKAGLKKLAKLRVNDVSVRLGTDWNGNRFGDYSRLTNVYNELIRIPIIIPDDPIIGIFAALF